MIALDTNQINRTEFILLVNTFKITLTDAFMWLFSAFAPDGANPADIKGFTENSGRR